ncbi:hypothetical protein GJ744_010168 [Endocarpon pusillum]|uniref:Arylamine N-acetyltransferase n=1 Tax=Endocarpon pusillum TaxID=364733 RepID=A0A8H7AHX7_9EURO|nr:hypothetical protein GJ744_010168 [Endocarpon pusillum]
MSTLSQRPTYTRSQLSQWLSLTNQTQPSLSLEHLEELIKQDPLETLRMIQLWQLATVPFGNLVLHYSQHHTVSLDSETLFHKIVNRRMGGYCMENNTFMATVLRSLGYILYTAGARVGYVLGDGYKGPQGYGGWGHMLNIVTVHDQKYMVDVGFGSSGAVKPIHLKDGEIVQSVPPARQRLVYQAIAQLTNASQKMWVFEVQFSPESSWIPQYCFSEVEFLPEDFRVMNYFTSQSRTSWFTQWLVMTKVILDSERKKPVGSLILSGNELKHRLHGHSETLVICVTEAERVSMLEKYFDVKLEPDEIRGVQGLSSEIK